MMTFSPSNSNWMDMGLDKNRNLDKNQCKSYRMQPVTLRYRTMMLCWLYLRLALNLEFFKAKQNMQQNSSQHTIWKTLQEGKPMKITESLGAKKRQIRTATSTKFPCVCHWNKNNQTETKSGKGHGLKPTFLGSLFVGWINQYLLRYETNFDILWLVKPPIWTETNN